MVIRATAKVIQSKNSATMYLTIPSAMVKDNEFPFGANEEVELEIKPKDKTIVVSGLAAKARRLLKEHKKEARQAKAKSTKATRTSVSS